MGIARAISTYIVGLNLSPYLLILVVGLMYLVLGMILDGISIVVMTLPIVLPVVLDAGFEPLWFGVFLVFMVELAQITPPAGFSIFVIQGISNEKAGTIPKASFPYLHHPAADGDYGNPVSRTDFLFTGKNGGRVGRIG